MSLTALTEWPARFSFVHRCLKTEIVNSRRDERRGGRRVAGDGVGARHGILTFKSPFGCAVFGDARVYEFIWE